jgi:hypothetical protein
MYLPPEGSLGDLFLYTSRYDVSNGRKKEKEVEVGPGVEEEGKVEGVVVELVLKVFSK